MRPNTVSLTDQWGAHDPGQPGCHNHPPGALRPGERDSVSSGPSDG
jgi:hypothetical protein